MGIKLVNPKFIEYFLPIVADVEVNFGDVLNAFELRIAMIEAGTVAVHFEKERPGLFKLSYWRI